MAEPLSPQQQRALRRLAGIDESELAARLPLTNTESLPLFG